ncbi:MAG: glycosyltransferase family 2 protein [Flavobacteriales bacterium]
MKISLITSTFNSASTVQSTFDSVRKQDHSDLEYLVVDGGSTDETIGLILSNSDIISNWITEPDKGIYDALNKGIQMATGEVIGFIHSDDFLADSNVISSVARAFVNKEVDAVYGDLQYVDRDDVNRMVRSWKSKPYRENLFRMGWMPAHPTFYLRKDAYTKYGVYNTNFRISADYELMLRMLLKHKLKSCYLPMVLVKMRVGGASNQSIKNRWLANQEDAKAWKINGYKPFFLTRWLKPLSKISQYWQ